MTNIFPKPPMVVFKQLSNLKKILQSHAKLSAQLTSNRQLTDGCPICPYIHHAKDVKSSITKETLLLNGLFSCLTKVVIYIITFTKHNVGQTGRRLNIKKYSINCIISIKNPTFTNHSSILTYADDTSNGKFQEEVTVK